MQSFFDRALTADPDNVDALIGSAAADFVTGASLFVTDPKAAFATAEVKLTKALSSVPDHARGHMLLGIVDMWTKRAAEGIAECEHALALDRNLAAAHAFIGQGKIFIGRAEETEAHIAEAVRLSPRDTLAYFWMVHVAQAKNQLGSWEQAVVWSRRSIELNRNFPQAHFMLCEVRRHRFSFLWRDPAENRILIVLPLWDCGQRDSAVHQIHSPSLDRHGSSEGAFVLGRTLRPNRGRRIGLPPLRDLAPDATQMVASLSKRGRGRPHREKPTTTSLRRSEGVRGAGGNHPRVASRAPPGREATPQ